MAELPALVAPDKFKGTLSAPEVAAAVARGLRAGGHEAVELPVADGGDGTLDALMSTLGGSLEQASVSDALGRPIEGSFGLIDDGKTAIVEMAQASGLVLVPEEERDPWAASTFGTGELIAAAVAAGASRVIVTVGGSATNDGGAGALEALEGVDVEMDVICDVRTPFEDAARLFGPQKGADAAMVRKLTARLERQAAAMSRDPRGVPMTGCAGGLSGALWAEHGARLHDGAAWVLAALGFDERMREAAFVVTGEGRIDEQTLQGKLVGEVATRCRQAGVPCHGVVGKIDLDPFAQRILDFASMTEAGTVEELEAAGRALVS